MGKFDEIILSVRKAEVSLFIGSGFSLKAGGPSSGYLVHSLARRFPKGYKRGLQSLPLDDIAKEYVKYCHGSRAELMDFLKEKMAFKRKDLSDHKALALIPHFNCIFTTNYDTLLEENYPEDTTCVVRCNVDCSKSKKAVNIYKIHGDLTYPEEVVISRDDYDELLTTDRNDLVWNNVVNAFTSSDVVFLGYSLEDTNVQRIVKKVSYALKDKRRRAFLIAPGLPEEKEYELAGLKIEYIDAYAEEFLFELTEVLKRSVLRDLLDGIVPTDIAKRFFDLYGIKAVLEFDGGKTKIKSIDPSLPSIPQSISFSAKAQLGEERNPSNFDFEEDGERNGLLKVPSIVYKKGDIVSFERMINGVKVMGLEDLGQINLGPSILKEGKMDIVVPEIGFIENTPYTTYSNKSKLVISFDTPLCHLDFLWDVIGYSARNCEVKTVYKEDYGQYEKAVAWTNFFIALYGGKKVLLGQIITGRLNPIHYKGLMSQFRKSLLYYENIRKIELNRKQTFVKHMKYEDGLDELSSIVLHLLNGDNVEEKLNMKDRIECMLNPDSDLQIPCIGTSIPTDYSSLIMETCSEQEIMLNDVNFGVIKKSKNLLKCHVEKIYEKDGVKYISIIPDVDHWVVKYTTA